MINFIHRLLHPHCPDCIQARQEEKLCESCETLRAQLEIANFEKKQLLDTILSFTKPVVEMAETSPIKIDAIVPKTVPWNVRRQMLENEDRAKAAILKKNADLEKELGVENG